MTYKNKQIIETVLNIESNNLNKNLDSLILHTLKDKYENKCTEHGFIINNTIELINRKLGKINTINNISCISYIVKYSCDIISPSIGDNLEIVVNTITKMGIIGYIKIDEKYSKSDKPFEISPLIIIVPKDEIDNMNDINVGQKLKVEILIFEKEFWNLMMF